MRDFFLLVGLLHIMSIKSDWNISPGAATDPHTVSAGREVHPEVPTPNILPDPRIKKNISLDFSRLSTYGFYFSLISLFAIFCDIVICWQASCMRSAVS